MATRILTNLIRLNSQNFNHKFEINSFLIRTYKSSIALDKLYPQSSLDITKPAEKPKNTQDKFSGYIPVEKLQISYSRSSGPGGQNVNTTNSKVDVRFQLKNADWIPDLIRDNIIQKHRTMINKDGFLVLQSDRTRSGHLNLADALEKIREILRSCEPEDNIEPSPETLEKLRKARERAARENLRQKRIKSFNKTSRGASSVD